MFGILGSGFGLYGYAPPLLMRYGNICLLEKSKDKCLARVELKDHMHKIEWAQTSQDLFFKATGLVIAKPPREQLNIIDMFNENSDSINNIAKIILEKPLAPTPEDGIRVIDFLKRSNIETRVGYIFIYLEWFKQLKSIIEQDIVTVNHITWKFSAFHFSHNVDTWKKYHSLGGGCLRFYGIHFIALLAILNINNINKSTLYYMDEDIPYRWEAEFMCNNGSQIYLNIDTNSSSNIFSVISNLQGRNLLNFTSQDIFPEHDRQYYDIRGLFIERLLESFDYKEFEYLAWYENTNALWAQIENKTTMEYT